MIVFISIVVPVLHETDDFSPLWHQLAEQEGDFEVLFVGECAGRLKQPALALGTLAEKNVKLLPVSGQGYEAHLDVGAAAASGEILFFLDLHNHLPPGALRAIERNLSLLPHTIGGNFHLKFYGGGPLDSLLSRLLKRFRYRGCYYNGSGIFVRKAVYEALNGFRAESALPDYDFVQRMEQYGPTLYLPDHIGIPVPSIRVVLTWLLAPLLAHSPLTRPILRLIRPDEPLCE